MPQIYDLFSHKESQLTSSNVEHRSLDIEPHLLRLTCLYVYALSANRTNVLSNRIHITFDSKTYVTRFIVEVYQPLTFQDKASSLSDLHIQRTPWIG